MRKYFSFKDDAPAVFFDRLPRHFAAEEVFTFYNSNGLDLKHGRFDCVFAAGAAEVFECEQGQAPAAFEQLLAHNNDWLCGFISYDFKNELENLSSAHPDAVGMPLLHFYRPQIVFTATHNEISIGYLGAFYTEEAVQALVSEMRNTTGTINPEAMPALIESGTRVDREAYLSNMERIQKHIRLGDIYEMNYCVEFFARYAAPPDIVGLYQRLNALSPAPFSCLYRLGDKALVCASPERFLQKKGTRLMSQPIKGTIQRGQDPIQDHMFARTLLHSEKDRSENVMIVDLVRNDMSHFADRDSVKVTELFGIYSYAQVHQMISTVECTLKPGASAGAALLRCFPPGSMTGAPKIRAMQIIEDTEVSKRGLYAGCVGFVTPGGDFDFNVVIRSIALNQSTCYASAMAGGAITALSDPQQEYEECLLKAGAMKRVLEG